MEYIFGLLFLVLVWVILGSAAIYTKALIETKKGIVIDKYMTPGALILVWPIWIIVEGFVWVLVPIIRKLEQFTMWIDSLARKKNNG